MSLIFAVLNSSRLDLTRISRVGSTQYPLLLICLCHGRWSDDANAPHLIVDGWTHEKWWQWWYKK